MTNLYQASVTIGGVAIAGQWDGEQLVALDQLEITWGRTSVYDDNVPSTLTMSVIDPDGDWATTNAIVGEPVTVSRLSPDTLMFVGRIADVSIRRVQITHPIFFTQVFVWIAELTCTDKLTDLDQLLIVDPGQLQAGDQGTAIGTASLTGTQRATQLLSLGASSIVSSIQAAVTAIGGATFPPFLRSHPIDEQLSALDLLTMYYNTQPFSHVNYNPTTDGIEIAGMASNDGLALVLVGGVIKLAPTSALVLDAENVKIPELDVSSPAASQIDQVVVPFYGTQTGGTRASMSSVGNATRYNPALKGQRVYTPKSDWAAGNTNTPLDYFTALLVTAIVAIVNVLNGRFHIGGLQYDFRRFGSAGASLDAVLLDTKSQAQAIYFKRSMLNRLKHCGPMFQLIGGKLTWFNKVPGSSLDAGWVLDMNVAPTTGAIPTVLFTALSTNATARIMDFDPDLTLNDIAHVTTGLS